MSDERGTPSTVGERAQIIAQFIREWFWDDNTLQQSFDILGARIDRLLRESEKGERIEGWADGTMLKSKSLTNPDFIVRAVGGLFCARGPDGVVHHYPISDFDILHDSEPRSTEETREERRSGERCARCGYGVQVETSEDLKCGACREPWRADAAEEGSAEGSAGRTDVGEQEDDVERVAKLLLFLGVTPKTMTDAARHQGRNTLADVWTHWDHSNPGPFAISELSKAEARDAARQFIRLTRLTATPPSAPALRSTGEPR